MKITFLHMTLGMVDRGSERSTILIAEKLGVLHEIHTISSSPLKSSSFTHHQIGELLSPPIPEPRNIFEKIIFRLSLDENSRHVVRFTRASLSLLKALNPDIIIPVNGHLQQRIVRDFMPSAKLVVFGRAGIGYHDHHSLNAGPDLFIALTPEAEKWALSNAPNVKVVYIPNPIETKEFKQVKKAKLALPRPIVLSISALTPYKNIEKIISAVAITNFSLLLIGQGSAQPEILSLAEAKLNKRFMYLPHIDPHELPSYYPASDIFCHIPNSQEAFGRVYLEAMASGLPIVATSDNIRRSLIGPKGFYADPNDEQSIVNALIQAGSHTGINYDDRLKEFELERVVKRIDDEFKTL